MRHAFVSLSVRNFRLFASGQVLSATGTWMMVAVQDWVVLDLTGDSASALGMVTALQFTPLLLMLYGGRLADTYDKRTLLTAANLVSGALALALAALVLAGDVRLWHIQLFALGLGVVNAVEIPTRMSFVSEIVGAELLPNASALSAAYFNVARVIGPAVAGLLITVVGAGWVMVLNGASYLATVAGLRMMRVAELHRVPGRPKERPRAVDGLRYTASRADLALPMALVGVVGLLGMNFQLTLPLMAKTEFHTRASSFGLLTTAFAAGSLLAALAATGRRGRPSQAAVVWTALAFGVLETVTGFAPSLPAAALLLGLTGAASISFLQVANHRIQLGSDPRFRGRVLALYSLVLQGSTPLGSVLVGALSEGFGARAGFWAGGLASCAAAAVALSLGDRFSDIPLKKRTVN